jgi:hypothetical protein
MVDRADYRYPMANTEDWCDHWYSTALGDEFYGDGEPHNFACRRPRRHDGEHWCPGQQDVEELALYIRRSFGIEVPEEGITA